MDYISQFRRAASKFLAATTLAIPISAVSDPVHAELPMNAKDTIPFNVLSHHTNETGETTLRVDANAIRKNKWAIAFDRITKAAIIMPGKPSDENAQCPYFDLSKYDYSIEQTRHNVLEFDIRVKTTPEESRLAIEKQCLVVDIPSSRKIVWKSDPN